MPDRIRIGVLILGKPQASQDFVTGHVRKVQVEQNDVVVVQLAEIDALFAQIRGVHVEAFRLQHQLDALRCGAVILDQQNPHIYPLFPSVTSFINRDLASREYCV
jgi:hypothetical protein